MELSPKLAWAWMNLGMLGGAIIRGDRYGRKECFLKAVELGANIAHPERA